MQALDKLGFIFHNKELLTFASLMKSHEDFDGCMATIEFLENCMHAPKHIEV